jgi:MFS family permease
MRLRKYVIVTYWQTAHTSVASCHDFRLAILVRLTVPSDLKSADLEKRATPTTASMASQLLTQLGQADLAAWVIPCITTSATITILIFGANSDLFGRRPFLLLANLVTAAGYIVCARAHNTSMLIAGLSLNGAGSGMAGVALIAVPELLVNYPIFCSSS